ncbi:pyridoxal-phosphate dependent enzyme [Lewinella sp. IMCC34183]|uniref:pyridoxal-phosphate dependent enzyme n=1 Tax=Lewinella sp. IMCC34183 TaxID=2248762 RepID=UPI000E22AB66|nr:pyridoxal-phosphate dependent enzyme [Lewinella sp. IMCC34183]
MLPPSPLEPLLLPEITARGLRCFVKRDDRYAFEPGSPLQGNKVRKLSPLLRRSDLAGRTVVTFGGAYSNHVAALAAAGERFGFRTSFLIRGEPVRNPVLDFAAARGGELRFLDRTTYRLRDDAATLRQLVPDPDHIIVPEGGTSTASLPLTGELFHETVRQLGYAPDYFCLSAGTGGTAAGVVAAAAGTTTHVEVFPALRGEWMAETIRRQMGNARAEFSVFSRYAGRGYAKFPAHWQLHRPAGALATRADIGVAGLPPLEPVYTAKLFTGVLDRVSAGAYPSGAVIVVAHTGGIY